MENEYLEEIKKIIEDHEKRIYALENAGKSSHPKSDKEISIKEFILQKKPRNDVDKTLVVGYYLEHFKSLSLFNVDDLGNAFKEGKEPPPKNINLAVIGNINKGRMMEANAKKDNKKTWTLTNTGERFIEIIIEKENRGGQ
jgi:hypothetical protein